MEWDIWINLGKENVLRNQSGESLQSHSNKQPQEKIELFFFTWGIAVLETLRQPHRCESMDSTQTIRKMVHKTPRRLSCFEIPGCQRYADGSPYQPAEQFKRDKCFWKQHDILNFV